MSETFKMNNEYGFNDTIYVTDEVVKDNDH